MLTKTLANVVRSKSSWEVWDSDSSATPENFKELKLFFQHLISSQNYYINMSFGHPLQHIKYVSKKLQNSQFSNSLVCFEKLGSTAYANVQNHNFQSLS